MHHSPGAFDRLPMPDDSPVLVVSGHTHGGQVAPMGRALVLPPELAILDVRRTGAP